jgi:hypothetical protein
VATSCRRVKHAYTPYGSLRLNPWLQAYLRWPTPSHAAEHNRTAAYNNGEVT